MSDPTNPTNDTKPNGPQSLADSKGTAGGDASTLSPEGLEQPVLQGAATPASRRRTVTRTAASTTTTPRTSTPAAAPVVANAGSVSFTIPLTITVSLGAVSQTFAAPAAPAPGGAAPSTEEGLQVDPDWSDREGYDTKFLDVEVPLPKLSAAMEADTVEVPTNYQRRGDRFVLDYHHYSVAMRQSRCFAWYSAANIDGRPERRPALPKRKDDQWHIDPRIDDPRAPKIQCGEELYVGANTDRGHLTRYLDLAWGDSLDEALAAMADSFHFTNCCLQLSGFNQGKDRWQGLEMFLLEKFAKPEQRRITVFTGPIFRDSDPVYQNPEMDYSIPIPLEFWKVCALVRKDGTLAATAFVLGQQDIARLPGFEASFDVTATQRTIAEIEGLTGLDFGPLRKSDHFAKGGAPGTLEAAREGGVRRAFRPLTGLRDIVL
jgi:endonuclease G, mitochondrial